MKLKLEHLAPYLPYKLKFNASDYGFADNYYPYMDAYGDEDMRMSINYILDEQWKPILRPLSDLVSDAKFLEFCKEEITCANLKVSQHEGLIGIEVLSCENELIAIYGEIAAECPYIFYQYLIENHYDINGLIENELATNINTIN